MKKVLAVLSFIVFHISCDFNSGTTMCVVHIYGDTTVVIPESRYEEDDSYTLAATETKVHIRKALVSEFKGKEGQDIWLKGINSPDTPIDWIVTKENPYGKDTTLRMDDPFRLTTAVYKRAKLLRL